MEKEMTTMNVLIPRPLKARLAFTAVTLGKTQNEIICEALNLSLEDLIEGKEKCVKSSIKTES